MRRKRDNIIDMQAQSQNLSAKQAQDNTNEAKAKKPDTAQLKLSNVAVKRPAEARLTSRFAKHIGRQEIVQLSTFDKRDVEGKPVVSVDEKKALLSKIQGALNLPKEGDITLKTKDSGSALLGEGRDRHIRGSIELNGVWKDLDFSFNPNSGQFLLDYKQLSSTSDVRKAVADFRVKFADGKSELKNRDEELFSKLPPNLEYSHYFDKSLSEEQLTQLNSLAMQTPEGQYVVGDNELKELKSAISKAFNFPENAAVRIFSDEKGNAFQELRGLKVLAGNVSAAGSATEHSWLYLPETGEFRLDKKEVRRADIPEKIKE
jgi:hypothetical protein